MAAIHPDDAHCEQKKRRARKPQNKQSQCRGGSGVVLRYKQTHAQKDHTKSSQRHQRCKKIRPKCLNNRPNQQVVAKDTPPRHFQRNDRQVHRPQQQT